MSDVTGDPKNLYAPERHHAIVAQARRDGRVEVTALAEQFFVTPETIRRDLTALERLGMVRRVHGGALPIERLDFEPGLAQRQSRLTTQKQRIALRALEEVPQEGSIILDAGTTTAALAAMLPAGRRLTVVTNAATIAALLMGREGIELILLGGRVRPETGAAVGEWALESLDGLFVDAAFMGTNGFSVERGMTTPDQSEATIKRAMVKAARRVVVMADSSKAAQDRVHRFATAADVALLVTDAGLDAETVEDFEAAGLDVARV